MRHDMNVEAERLEENLKELNSYNEVVEKISGILSKSSNAVNRLSNASRGNSSDVYDSKQLDIVHSRLVDKSVQGFKSSIVRFSNSK